MNAQPNANHESSITLSRFTFCSLFITIFIGLQAPIYGASRAYNTVIKPGAYRIDLNGKIRDLCVDEIGNGELSAKGWQARLAEQGVRCQLSNVRRKDSQLSWTGTCSAPGMGKIFETRHDVFVKINADRSFDILTLLSGDLQARIPVRGSPITESGVACTSQHDTFRPWQ
jgi:hypothetical protein